MLLERVPRVPERTDLLFMKVMSPVGLTWTINGFVASFNDSFSEFSSQVLTDVREPKAKAKGLCSSRACRAGPVAEDTGRVAAPWLPRVAFHDPLGTDPRALCAHAGSEDQKRLFLRGMVHDASTEEAALNLLLITVPFAMRRFTLV